MPLVSVIIPAHNAAQYLSQTLETVREQTHVDWEAIIVDDGSTDETPEISRKYAEADGRFRLIQQHNQGVAAARNTAINAAQGEYIAPLDADDLWDPRKLELQVTKMEQAGPSMGFAYCRYAAVSAAGQTVGLAPAWHAEGNLYHALLFSNFTGHASTPLIRRACLEELGAYNTKFHSQKAQGCEDWDLLLRIARRFDVGCVDSYVSYYRVTTGSMSGNIYQMARAYELVLDEVRNEDPDIPQHIFEWSRANYYMFLATRARSLRDLRGMRTALRQVLRADPTFPNFSRATRHMVLGHLVPVARPFVKLIWRTPESRLKAARRIKSLAWRMSSGSSPQGKPNKPWSSRSAFDRLYRARWEQLLQESRRPATKLRQQECQAL